MPGDDFTLDLHNENTNRKVPVQVTSSRWVEQRRGRSNQLEQDMVTTGQRAAAAHKDEGGDYRAKRLFW